MNREVPRLSRQPLAPYIVIAACKSITKANCSLTHIQAGLLIADILNYITPLPSL
ncbi:hypothetical protein BDV40DRAFT_281967 [Aspergillus tamarii]|uniref:Uncharacterized protein n=1 Tax=Aspergillus tamarii TaxID=41984 RepID=A0A5N6UC69_ASPTM|nr:hypothetical protein BDV40DRAFT_281967 [Aspergillus tamarii]